MIATRQRELSGWGRYPRATCRVAGPSYRGQAVELVGDAGVVIARGAGRSYGDASLNPELTLETGKLDRILSFDASTGDIECEAGVLLADLIDLFLQRGWISPVTPGTRFVTVGGMVAADVHGKNHHVAGSFADHLEWLDIVLADGSVVRCSRTERPELFAATCGGMGLTGVILRCRFRLMAVPSAVIRERTLRCDNIDSAIDAFESTLDAVYSVAWIDALATGNSLGRSIIYFGDHAEVSGSDRFHRPQRRALAVPIDFPNFALTAATVRLHNLARFHTQATGERLVALEPYFYPLDAIANWNRIYGRRGFVQYQCVLPLEASRAGMKALLEQIARSGNASFLAVLKRMGAQSAGMLSFPMPGYTLALDFPLTPTTLRLLDTLDEITAEHGGRIYLAKDARAAPSALATGYPRLGEFAAARARWDPQRKFSSLLSQRLSL